MAELPALAGLFLTAMAAGSVLPLSSEAAFVALLLTGVADPWLLTVVATAGNLSGAAINWFLGVAADRFSGRRWFPVGPQALEKARAWYRKYGRWSLLLSWVPVVGDPLTVAAGVMREPLPSFLVIVGIAKFFRYAILAMASAGLS